MTDDKKSTRVIMIAHSHRSGKKQRLAAAYAAGQIKQAQIAGEYPPPNVLPDNDREGAPQLRRWEPVMDERTRDAWKHVNFQEIEERVLARQSEPPRELGRFNCRGDYVLPDNDRAAKWVNVNKRGLSAIDRARRFVDLYSRGPTKTAEPPKTSQLNLHQLLTSASILLERRQEWEAVLEKQGYTQSATDPDIWTKEDDDV